MLITTRVSVAYLVALGRTCTKPKLQQRLKWRRLRALFKRIPKLREEEGQQTTTALTAGQRMPPSSSLGPKTSAHGHTCNAASVRRFQSAGLLPRRRCHRLRSGAREFGNANRGATPSLVHFFFSTRRPADCFIVCRRSASKGNEK